MRHFYIEKNDVGALVFDQLQTRYRIGGFAGELYLRTISLQLLTKGQPSFLLIVDNNSSDHNYIFKSTCTLVPVGTPFLVRSVTTTEASSSSLKYFTRSWLICIPYEAPLRWLLVAACRPTPLSSMMYSI